MKTTGFTRTPFLCGHHDSHGPWTSAEPMRCQEQSHRNSKKTPSAATKLKSIVPLLDRVLVQRLKAQEKTAAGIFIPEKAQETLNEGVVIAVGEGAFDKEGKRIPVLVSAGDKVLLPPFGGSNVKVGNEEYILFRDSELLAKVQEN
ncbi:10 kDa heat shock protein [Apophysomyces ossiformis]|uniref:10 kDa heat shock protein n=1 Tax=Apophysomyces ossiformis TaxID=679940 RepID=A0A8H7BJ87_9FUNG|nr:10 kDa heat shock protein [Apophysomyces ossiformis]